MYYERQNSNITMHTELTFIVCIRHHGTIYLMASVTFTLTYTRLLILNTRTAEYETSYKLIVKTGQTQ